MRAYRGRLSPLLDVIDGVRDAVLTFTGAHATTHLPGGVDPLAFGVPVDVGASNAPGSGNAYALHDHVHAHGSHGGGALHAEATAAAAGFMPAAMWSYLNDFIPRPAIRYPIRNESGSSIPKRTPVAAVGYHAATDSYLVAIADYADPARRPALGLVEADVAHGANGYAIKVGRLVGINTSQDDNGLPLAVNDTLVLGPAGKLVRPPPATLPFDGEIQLLAQVTRVGVGDGEVDVLVEGIVPESLFEQSEAIPAPEGVVTGGATRAAATTFEGAAYLLERDTFANRIIVKVSGLSTPGNVVIAVYQAGGSGGVPAAKVASVAGYAIAATGTKAIPFDEGIVRLERGLLYVLWGKNSGGFSMSSYATAAVDLLTDASYVDAETHPTSFTTSIPTTSIPTTFNPRPVAAGGDATPTALNVVLQCRFKKV